MRLVSWNVNGIRSAERNGLLGWIGADPPDLLCLQETRAQPGQLPEHLLHPPGFQSFWHSAERKGYSGVATFCRRPPLTAGYGLGLPHFDAEGRVLITRHPGFTLVNAYVPSGRRGLERVAFKLEFSDALLETCTALRARGEHLVVCGDLNTAHQPIDLARPRQNVKTSGFLPVEREALGRWLASGFVDAFRHLHPETVAYTWWTNRFESRARNVGWRIDYFLVDAALMHYVEDARILAEVRGSDHCPIELLLALPEDYTKTGSYESVSRNAQSTQDYANPTLERGRPERRENDIRVSQS